MLPSNAVAGETSLDRLANALGGKAVLPHIISNIPQMLQSGQEGGREGGREGKRERKREREGERGEREGVRPERVREEIRRG